MCARIRVSGAFIGRFPTSCPGSSIGAIVIYLLIFLEGVLATRVDVLDESTEVVAGPIPVD
jgi:hypothetical protein